MVTLHTHKKVFIKVNSYWKNKEHLLMVGAWLIVYASVPLYLWYAAMQDDILFRWDSVYMSWTMITVFLVLFLIHHFFLIPRLFLRKRYVAYIAALLLCLGVFTAWLVSHGPESLDRRHMAHRHHEGRKPQLRMKPMPHKKRMMLTPPDMARLVIALMMIGVDLGSVAWINSQKLRQRLLLLEQQNLKQELEHLRYQINPHFFMNTLNSIHILVDIDQERAKRAIIELSGLMRHSLYNGSETLTSIHNEINFLRQYISLMELRFGSKVAVTADLPAVPLGDLMMPPLIFATFVENAYKHGISYQSPSFINISLTIGSDRKVILFTCENSRNTIATATQDGNHGIGLNNVRKRLDLQYGDRYSLNIDTTDPQCFRVELSLPV